MRKELLYQLLRWSAAGSLVVFYGLACAQQLEQNLDLHQIEAHLRFLAADELKGRKTGESGNWVAARYIAEQFRRYGAEPGNGSTYFQVIPFATVTPASSGTLQLGDKTLGLEDNLLIRLAPAGQLSGELLFLPHATADEVTDRVKGKMVLAYMGNEEVTDPQGAFMLTADKKRVLKEKGALGLVEIYQGRHPWNLIKRYLGGGSMVVMDTNDDPGFPSLVVNDLDEETLMDLKVGKKLAFHFETDGTQVTSKPSPNVIGLLKGSDPSLRDEYVVLSAHFDHVGTYTSSDRPATESDSIFNGARDNAFGVAALLAAAEMLGEEAPKRSVLFIAFTGEEIGLVGSKYFVDHPTVPLDKIVFNLNTDGAGNSDSTIVSVMGLNRVGAGEELEEACQAFGLTTFADPAPEQNLFDRSDNVSFAAKGIPAPTFSPGFKQFDNEILKHYHQPSDEVETLDLHYVLKFCKAYAFAGRLVADMQERPRWSTGDKYEPAFLQLYGGSK